MLEKLAEIEAKYIDLSEQVMSLPIKQNGKNV